MSDDLSIPTPTYRIPRHSRGMDPATKRLAIIAGALGGVLVMLIGGWSLIGRQSDTVPIVQADTRPIRVKPDNPGGMQVAGASDDILSGSTDAAGGKLAPPPEAPAPQALRAPPPEPAAPAPTAAAPLPAATQAATPKVPTPSRPTAVTASEKLATDKPAPSADKHSTAPVVPVAAQAGSAANHTLVQLAAVSSEEAAKSEWQRLEKRIPDLLSSRQPAYSKVERDGRTYWRLRTGGFTDVAQATLFCGRVRAKGASCSVADF